MGKKKQSSEPESKVDMKDDMQDYACILKPLGDCRMLVKVLNQPNDKEIVGIIRGGIRRVKPKISPGDIVLISYRGLQSDDKKCDIIHRYTTGEVKQMIKSGTITRDYEYEKDTPQEEDGFVFEEI